jgi:hypothetical protein
LIGFEGCQFCGSWWEASEVEGDAAKERRAVGFGARGDVLGFELGLDEGVHRIADCGLRIPDFRQPLARDWLESPVIAVGFGDGRFADGRRVDLNRGLGFGNVFLGRGWLETQGEECRE